MKRLRRAIPVLGASASLIAAHAVAAGPAAAEIYTCGSMGNRWDGYASFSNDPPTNPEGTSASLVVRFGAVCDTDRSQPPALTNFQITWVMIANHNGQGNKYSQAGYGRWYNSAIYPYAEYNNGSGFSRVFDYNHPQTLGTTHAAKTIFATTNCVGGPTSCFKNYYDGTVMQQTNYAPLGNFTYPYSSQVYGEVLYAESDMPGTSGAPMQFSNIQSQRFSDNQWQPFLPSPVPARNDNTARWGLSSFPTNYFSIWTN